MCRRFKRRLSVFQIRLYFIHRIRILIQRSSSLHCPRQVVKAVAKGQPDVIILTTLYKHTSDFIKIAQKEGLGAMMASNSFPGASPLQKELGKDGPGVVIATVVPPFSKGMIPIVGEYRAAIEKLTGKKEYSFT